MVKNHFQVKTQIQPSRMGKMAKDFVEMDSTFQNSAMGRRVADKAVQARGRLNNGVNRSTKTDYLNALMDYFNRLSFFAKENGQEEMYHYIQQHVSNLEREKARISAEIIKP